jgi:hypothetical protein
MLMANISVPDSLFQRLEVRAQETGRPVDEMVVEALESSLETPTPVLDRRAQSLALLEEISGSFNIPDLDASKHDLYFIGIEDDDDDE